MLLPDEYRSDNGTYYTSPAIAERLLDTLAAEEKLSHLEHLLAGIELDKFAAFLT